MLSSFYFFNKHAWHVVSYKEILWSVVSKNCITKRRHMPSSSYLDIVLIFVLAPSDKPEDLIRLN